MFRGTTVENNNSIAPDLIYSGLFGVCFFFFFPSNDLLVPTLSLFLPHKHDFPASSGQV